MYTEQWLRVIGRSPYYDFRRFCCCCCFCFTKTNERSCQANCNNKRIAASVAIVSRLLVFFVTAETCFQRRKIGHCSSLWSLIGGRLKSFYPNNATYLSFQLLMFSTDTTYVAPRIRIPCTRHFRTRFSYRFTWPNKNDAKQISCARTDCHEIPIVCFFVSAVFSSAFWTLMFIIFEKFMKTRTDSGRLTSSRWLNKTRMDVRGNFLCDPA